MEKYIKRSDAIKAMGQQYPNESDRMTALQELPVLEVGGDSAIYRKDMAKIELYCALLELKNAWMKVSDAMGNIYFDVNDYILGDEKKGDAYPFHMSFDEMKVSDWIKGSLERILNEPSDIGVMHRSIEPCEPTYLGENTLIGHRDGRCRCGNVVRSYQKFCDECGAELEWGNVHAPGRKIR